MKITKMNFQFEGDEESIAMAIMRRKDEIEKHISPPDRPNWYKT